YFDNLELAQLLIHGGANVNAANEYGVTPLALACTNASPRLVEALLRGKADPRVSLPTGETILMTCARTGSEEAVTLLLKAGADIQGKESSRGQTALMWAAVEGHE